MGADENVAATYYSHLIIYVLHVSVKHYETQIEKANKTTDIQKIYPYSYIEIHHTQAAAAVHFSI